jgi:hypothetical protein
MAALVGGCTPDCGCACPPVSVHDYEQMEKLTPECFSPGVIIMHNIQRLLDKDLAVPARVESLALLDRLCDKEEDYLSQIASVLDQPSCPPQVTKATLELLLKRDYAGLASYAVRGLPSVGPENASFQQALMDWFDRHGDPAILAEVLRAWAAEPKADGPLEDRYRQLVAKIAKKDWDQAVLATLDMTEFSARGSAIEILAKRLPPAQLRVRVMAVSPKSDAMIALQTCIDSFDYFPTAGGELLSAVCLYKSRREGFAQAARVNGTWRDAYGYKFNIRDFHLLRSLSGDAGYSQVTRAQLVADLTKQIDPRQHVRIGGSQPATFAKLADSLTLADLWNVYLVNQMLGRQRVREAIRVMAENDRADLTGAWGGLLFFEGNQAEAMLYPADHSGGENDLVYTASADCKNASRDSLGRFIGHFEKLSNAQRAGPTADELRDAKDNNYYCLVLTTINETTFAAHYFNPAGNVVSLGNFPLDK